MLMSRIIKEQVLLSTVAALPETVAEVPQGWLRGTAPRVLARGGGLRGGGTAQECPKPQCPCKRSQIEQVSRDTVQVG